MTNIIKFPNPKVETIVDTLNRMDSDTLDQVLMTLFETNETRAVDISRGLEILALDKHYQTEGVDYE